MKRETEQITLIEEQNIQSEDGIKNRILNLKDQIDQTSIKHEEAMANREV